ncbi:MAG: hypothetical protein WA653_23890, partial [Candidatus Sulfotelmatobacter sp.]
MEKATTCVPALTAISDGVLPTYFPSNVISAPGGVEVKLHRTFSVDTGTVAGVEPAGARGVGEAGGGVTGCGSPAVPDSPAAAGGDEGRCGTTGCAFITVSGRGG